MCIDSAVSSCTRSPGLFRVCSVCLLGANTFPHRQRRVLGQLSPLGNVRIYTWRKYNPNKRHYFKAAGGGLLAWRATDTSSSSSSNNILAYTSEPLPLPASYSPVRCWQSLGIGLHIILCSYLPYMLAVSIYYYLLYTHTPRVCVSKKRLHLYWLQCRTAHTRL